MQSKTDFTQTMLTYWRAPSSYDSIVGRKNALQLIQLRWIAVVGQISTIAIVNLVFNIAIPTPAMLAILIFLIALIVSTDAESISWFSSVSGIRKFLSRECP